MESIDAFSVPDYAPTSKVNALTIMAKIYKPGEIADKSGQYEILGPKGGHTGIERTVTKGEPLPPTLESGQTFRLADKTHTS